MSETDPFLSEEGDGADERTRLEAYFMQSLEVDLLLRVCPDEEDTIWAGSSPMNCLLRFLP